MVFVLYVCVYICMNACLHVCVCVCVRLFQKKKEKESCTICQQNKRAFV